MKKLLLATVSTVALATGVQAADLSAKPVYKAAPAPAPAPAPTWAGFYIGVQGGAVWHDASFKDVDAFFSVPAGTTYSSNATGGIVGGNIGYNWQFNNFVFGFEGDGNWVGAKAGSTYSSPNVITSYDVRWLASVRARAGLAFDAWLFYVTGGVAFAGVNDSANFVGSNVSRFAVDQTRAGGIFGGGIEYMFARNWTARVEAMAADFGRVTTNCPTAVCGTANSGAAYRGEFTNRLITAMAALDYKF